MNNIDELIDWTDCKDYIKINPPQEFSFSECLVYLSRSELECMHKVEENTVYKLLKLEDECVLIKVYYKNNCIYASFENCKPSKRIRAKVALYVWRMFDLGTDIKDFYCSINDDILSPLFKKYYGLRIIKINDLFEALCWAVIGQQINLKFAYTLKRRFVESYGEGFTFSGDRYWLFPKPETVAALDLTELKKLQFTGRKAEYIIGLAKCFTDGTLNEVDLRNRDYEYLVNKLVSIRGIGKWSADYTILKCFNLNNAFPIADVGIHNAMKNILKRDKKPTITEIEANAKHWKGWESYATFYLWRSLYD